ncbi:pilus assembly protein PilL [Ralstonia pickettii]|nr:pilus assembly protein PilL [Ralstonia pickettii]
MLASMFGAIAIRDNKGGATEIRFEGAPPTDLRLTDMQGRLLPAAWRGTVLSLPPIAQFTLSDLNQAVDVARVQGVEYQFHDDSVTGLEVVFEEAGATFLTFNTTKRRVSVLGDGHPISGMLNGRHYKLNGIAGRLVVIADGEVVHIERVSSVHFYERAGTP